MNPCAIGSSCDYVSSSLGVCVLTRIRERGQTCDPNIYSDFGCSLPDNLVCDEATYRCADIGDGSEGASCIDDSACDAGLACLAHVCRTGADGSSCTSNDECRSGYCAGVVGGGSSTVTPGTCAPYGPWSQCP